MQSFSRKDELDAKILTAKTPRAKLKLIFPSDLERLGG
jgi:hypothetical protein